MRRGRSPLKEHLDKPIRICGGYSDESSPPLSLDQHICPFQPVAERECIEWMITNSTYKPAFDGVSIYDFLFLYAQQ